MSDASALRRATGITGLSSAALFGAGNALWVFDQPADGASAGTLVDFYTDASSRITVGASLSLLGLAVFVFYASGLRSVLVAATREDLLPNAGFGGALLLVATGLGAETINLVGAARAGDGQLSPELARSLFEISYVLGYPAAGIGVGIFIAATALAALRSGALLPRWLAMALLGLGLAFASPLSRPLLAPAVMLLALASLAMARGPSSDARAAPAPPAGTKRDGGT